MDLDRKGGHGNGEYKIYARVDRQQAALRQAEVELANGATMSAVCRKLGLTNYTYHRWRSEYGGMRLDQARRLMQLEQENARLKQLVADQALDIEILKEDASGSF